MGRKRSTPSSLFFEESDQNGALMKKIFENLKDLPVILTMIEPIEEMIKAGMELGMNDYIVKPFDVFTLAKVLEKVIETEGGEAL